MPNSVDHVTCGACVGAAAYLTFCRMFQRNPTWLGLVGCTVAGSALALGPDLLEPASDPNHRRFFHSLAMLAVLAIGDYKLMTNLTVGDEEKLGLLAASAGYASHLLMDGLSPRSLPAV